MSLPWFLVFRSHLSNIHIPTFIPHHVSNSALQRDVNITGVLTKWMCEKQQVPTLSSLPALATLELNIGHNTGAEGSSSARVAKQTQGRAICSHREGGCHHPLSLRAHDFTGHIAWRMCFYLFFWSATLNAQQLTSTSHSTGPQGFFVRNGVLGLPVSVCSPEVVAGSSFCAQIQVRRPGEPAARGAIRLIAPHAGRWPISLGESRGPGL